MGLDAAPRGQRLASLHAGPTGCSADEDGWLWASDEEWGWATCHYGRWFFDDRYGWVWVPGRDWAPAWVAWRFGGGYVGWAPLPPQVRWNAGVGFRVGDVDFDAWITPRQYVFVPERHFVDPARLPAGHLAGPQLDDRQRDPERHELRSAPEAPA